MFHVEQFDLISDVYGGGETTIIQLQFPTGN